jgi:hypothetical protein
LDFEIEMLLITTIRKEHCMEAVFFSLQGLNEILAKGGEQARDRLEQSGGLELLEKV